MIIVFSVNQHETITDMLCIPKNTITVEDLS